MNKLNTRIIVSELNIMILSSEQKSMDEPGGFDAAESGLNGSLVQAASLRKASRGCRA